MVEQLWLVGVLALFGLQDCVESSNFDTRNIPDDYFATLANCPEAPKGNTGTISDLQIESRIYAVAEEVLEGMKASSFIPLLQDDGSFNDLDVIKPGDLRKHGKRLGSIILHELKTGQISKKSKEGIVYLLTNPGKIDNKGWWMHIIGAPSDLWTPIFLARNHISEDVKSKFLVKYFEETREGPIWDLSERSGKMAGGNLGSRIFLALVNYLLRDSMAEFDEQLRKVLCKEVIHRDPWDGNGMRHDSCIHQHNVIKKVNNVEKVTIYSLVYNNNYGKEFLKNTARVMWILDGTRFDLGDELEEGIFASFLECEQWLYRHKTVEPATVGKYITSGQRITRHGGLDAVFRPLMYYQNISRHEDQVQAALQRYQNYPTAPPFALEGNRHFFVSDLMAHQRHKFMASLRILSKRTIRPETWPNTNENAKGYFEGDGFLTVMVTGGELGSYKQEIFQAYNWARVPGVTCQYREEKDIPQVPTPYVVNLPHAINNADFVGGVSNKKDGVAAMDYNRPTVSLTAKKSWFFSNDVILCLGSGISLPSEDVSENSVTTTLNQVMYGGSHEDGYEEQHHIFTDPVEERQTATHDMKESLWFYHDSVGYVPMVHAGSIVEEVVTRNIDGNDQKPSISLYSLWLDHKADPTDASYAYAMLPGQTVEETKSFALSPSAQILKLQDSLHAVCFTLSKLLGAVFFEKGCVTADCLNDIVQEICTDEPVLLIVKELSNESVNEENCPGGLESLDGQSSIILQISAADPTQKLSQAVFTLETSSGSYAVPIQFPPPPLAGKSFTKCYEIPQVN